MISAEKLENAAKAQNMTATEYLVEFFYSRSTATRYLGKAPGHHLCAYQFEGRGGRVFYLRSAVERSAA